MPANLALTSKHRYFSRPRRLADLDRWLKIPVPLFLLASLFFALDSGFFNTYLRLFQRNTYTSLLSAVGAVYALASFLLSSYYLRHERDADFVYGVITISYSLPFSFCAGYGLMPFSPCGTAAG
jgi:hypothetical protein